MAKCNHCNYYPKCDEMPFDESGCSDFMGWIPVSDRLPDKSDDICIVVDIEHPHRLPRVVRGNAFTVTEYWGVVIGYYAHDQKVTHWMPLPEPPKED